MCINSITKIVDKPTEKVYIGYKEFHKRDDDLHYGPFYGGPYVRRRWYEAPEGQIEMGHYKSTTYPAGFHIFKNKKDAIKYAGSARLVSKVYYKGVLVRGRQDSGVVHVARHMRIA